MSVFALAAHNAKKSLLNSGSNGSSRAATNGDSVDASNGSDLGSRTGKKNLIRDVEEFAGNGLLMDRQTKVPAERKSPVVVCVPLRL
jgi:hypothetical protein